jgi:hypothetical protein
MFSGSEKIVTNFKRNVSSVDRVHVENCKFYALALEYGGMPPKYAEEKVTSMCNLCFVCTSSCFFADNKYPSSRLTV